MTSYYKFLTVDKRGPFSCFKWPIGEWVEVKGPLEMCRNGIHVTPIEHAIHWVNARCYRVEVRGEILEGDKKVCLRAARLTDEIEAWNETSARLLAADCAEHVLPFFEREYPEDDGPRRAIEAARQFARGEIGEGELAASRAASRDAACDAARAAARAEADAAAASRAASMATPWDADKDAERAWQTGKLREILEGERE